MHWFVHWFVLFIPLPVGRCVSRSSSSCLVLSSFSCLVVTAGLQKYIHTHMRRCFLSTVLDHVGRTIALSCCVDSGRRYWYRCGKARDSSLALHPTDSHAPCVLPFSRRIVNLHVSILTIYLVRDGSHDFLLTTLVSKYTNFHGCIHDNTVWTVPSRLP